MMDLDSCVFIKLLAPETDSGLFPITVRKARQVRELCHPEVPLRALDALHVAACDLSQDFPLCATDPRMRDAAKMLGIPVFPEEAAA